MKRIIGSLATALILAGGIAWAQENPSQGAPSVPSQPDNAYKVIADPIPLPEKAPETKVYRQGLIDFQAGRLATAASELEAVEAKFPNSANVHSLLGYIYLKQNKSADALRQMQTVVTLAPQDLGARNNLGRAYLQTGDYAKAAAQFQEIVAIAPSSADAQYDLGIALAKSGDYAGSAVALQKAIAAKPTGSAYQNLGVVLQKTGQYAAAADAFQQAAVLEPGNTADTLNAGLLYEQSGQHEKAIPALTKALANSIDSKFQAHQALAQAYVATHDNAKAIQEFNAASELQPTDPTVFFNLGVLNQQAGQTAAAEASYQKVLDLNPADPKILLAAQTNLGLLYANDGNVAQSIPLLTAAEQADPKAPATHAALGNLYAKQGNVSKAMDERRTAIQLDPSDTQSRLLLADALLAGKKYAEAAAQYAAVVKSDPMNAPVQNALGTAYEEKGDTARALAAFKAAVNGRGTPQDKAQAYNNLGVVYEKQGKKSQAIVSYKKAVALAPSLSEAKKNLARFQTK